MAVNIDDFIDKFDTKEENKKPKKNSYDVNVDFQKEVEDKLENIRKDMTTKDYEIVKKVYEEVKNFDQDLPNKFFGIERKSTLTLKDIGSRYSQQFYEIAKSQGSNVMQSINQIISRIDNGLQNKHYTTILKDLESLKDLYKKFPPGFGKQRAQVGLMIKDREIKIFDAIDEYKKQKTHEIRKKFTEELESIEDCIKSNDSVFIDNTLKRIEDYLNKIPKILLSNISEERKKLTQKMMEAEKHLDTVYEQDFQNKRSSLYELFGEFQKYYLKKDLKKCATLYDQILIEFDKIPDVFLEEKMKLYSQVNELYGSMNNLILNSNVTIFLEAYKNSKTIEEIKDFISHVKNTGHIQPSTLDIAKKKIESLPSELKHEREDLKKELIKLMSQSLPQQNNAIENKTIDYEKKINEKYNLMKKSESKEEVEKLYNEIYNMMKNIKLEDGQQKVLSQKIESTYNQKLSNLKS